MHVKQTDDALSRQWVGGSAETANDPRPTINPVISRYLAAEKEAERFAALAAPRAVLRQRSMRYRSLRWPPCVALLCCFVLYAVLRCVVPLPCDSIVCDVRDLHDLAFQIIIIL